MSHNKEHPKRTIKQNKAMHKYFAMVAEALNESGFDMRKTLKASIDIPWTPESVKNHLWRPIQEVMLNIESTSELDSADPSEVYNVLSRHLATKLGVSVPWPHNDPYDELGSKK